MYQLTETGMAEDDFDRAIEFVIGPSFAATWAQMKSDYVDGCKDIPLDTILSSVGVKVSLKETLPTEHAETAKQLLGIRTTAQQGWIKLTHVLDAGLAQQAGLAAGDYLASINGERTTPGRLDHLLTQLIQKLSRGQAVKVAAYRHDSEFVAMFQARSDIASNQPKQYSISIK
jgi:predicted metalloprotease with PDZ domain